MEAILEYPFGCNLLVLQPTPFCNLNCSYCYLNNKDNPEKMSVKTLSLILSDVLNNEIITKDTTIVWHAGEPLATSIKHFRTLLDCVKKNDTKKYFHHSIQTNGVLIDDQWCDLFKEYEIDIGVSIDGPLEINDSRRIDRKGKGSFEKAMRGLNLLIDHGVKHHIISVLTKEALEKPKETLDFFIGLGVHRLGFNIEEVEGINVQSSAYAGGLSSIQHFFDLAHKSHINPNIPISIREFERVYNIIAKSPDQRGKTTFVNMNEQVKPFGILSVDYLGNYSTFSPELLGQNSLKYNNFIFGNALDKNNNLKHFLENKYLNKVFRSIQSGVQKCAETCQYFAYCGGGSPSNKFYENDSFASAETYHCKSMIQIPFNVVLKALEETNISNQAEHET